MRAGVLLIVVCVLGAIAVLLYFLLQTPHNDNNCSVPKRIANSQPIDSKYLTKDLLAANGVYIIMGDNDKNWLAVTKMQVANVGVNSKGQFDNDPAVEHYAFLFDNGIYEKTIMVGYYTTVTGLDPSPQNVQVGAYCLGDWTGLEDGSGGSLNTFWRSLENVTLTPLAKQTIPGRGFSLPNDVTWAVSQASPLRRCIIKPISTSAKNDNPQGVLALAIICPDNKACLASGGFSSDNQLSNGVLAMSQQQWLSLADAYNSPVQNSEAVWNQVYIGCANINLVDPTKTLEVKGKIPYNVPNQTCHGTQGIVTKLTSNYFSENNLKRARKPYVVRKDVSTLECVVPTLQTPQYEAAVAESSSGFTFAYDESSLRAALSSAARIVVIASKRPIALCAPLVVGNQTVLLGLGVPTLLLTTKDAQILITGDNCQLAGLLIDCGAHVGNMLEWRGKNGVMHDIYTRVGGSVSPACCSCDTQMLISGNVIAENLWLWRADHDASGGNPACEELKTGGLKANASLIGLRVLPKANFLVYGLASEHNLQYNVLWEGSGYVFFYQSELPYCVSESYDFPGFKLKLATDEKFEGYGFGIYHFFAQGAPQISTAVNTSESANGTSTIAVDGIVSVLLTGAGTIEHVIDKKGCATSPSFKNSTYIQAEATDITCPQCHTQQLS
jgi:hypothetical protein